MLFLISSMMYAHATIITQQGATKTPTLIVPSTNGNKYNITITPNPVQEIDLTGADFVHDLSATKRATWIPGWKFLQGQGIPGTFYVLKYNAVASTLDQSSASSDCNPRSPVTENCFTLEFRGNISKRNLFWMQTICTNVPDGGYNNCGNSKDKPYLDGSPDALKDKLPFYLNATEMANVTLTNSKGFGIIIFKDRPFRDFPTTGSIYWYADLYLVEWDGKKTVTIQNGTRWGFEITCAGSGNGLYKSGGVGEDFADAPFKTTSLIQSISNCPLNYTNTIQENQQYPSEVESNTTVPEFGTIAVMIFSVSTIGVLIISRKFKFVH